MAPRKHDEELENPESWDWDRAERRPGNAASRAVASVAFPTEDFQRVAEAAQHSGMKISQFIRRAAIEKAHGQMPATPMPQISSSASFTPFTLTLRPVSMVEHEGWSIHVQAVHGDGMIIIEGETAVTW